MLQPSVMNEGVRIKNLNYYVILVQYVEGKGPSVGHEPEGRVSLERGHSVRASTHYVKHSRVL